MNGSHRGAEQRKEERVQASLPVDLHDARGIAKDVSPSGIYFETDGRFEAKTPISFAVSFDTPGGKMVLDCRGEVVRVVKVDAKLGVAVRIVDSFLRTETPGEVG